MLLLLWPCTVILPTRNPQRFGVGNRPQPRSPDHQIMVSAGRPGTTSVSGFARPGLKRDPEPEWPPRRHEHGAVAPRARHLPGAFEGRRAFETGRPRIMDARRALPPPGQRTLTVRLWLLMAPATRLFSMGEVVLGHWCGVHSFPQTTVSGGDVVRHVVSLPKNDWV